MMNETTNPEDRRCVTCKDRGRTTPGSEQCGTDWMCVWCYAGFDGPDDPTIGHTSMRIRKPLQKAAENVGAVREPPKEITMSAKIAIDENKLRELHAQGLSDREIAEKFGCSAAGVLYARRKLGLAAIGKRGPRKSKGNGTVGDAMARIDRKRRNAALAKAGAHVDSRLRGNDRNGSKVYGLMIEDLTAQRDKFQAAIDALSALAEN